GPLAQAAGHDINYISLSGALRAIGRKGERPVPPLNLVGDFGGGGMMLAYGIVCGLLEAQRSGQGQVIDMSMVDGSAVLMGMFFSLIKYGYDGTPGTSFLDGTAHFYDTYETSDGKYVSVGAIEPQFYKLLLDKCGIDDPAFAKQMDAASWPDLKAKLAELFRTKTRDEWCALLEGTDACFAPVLSILEAPEHPHNKARGTYVDVGGLTQPAPAPRFSRTTPDTPQPIRPVGADTRAVLEDCGFDGGEIDELLSAGVVAQV
ncbi:MAG: CoA transferase, partial [Candidatus Dadabacteria bacterium]